MRGIGRMRSLKASRQTVDNACRVQEVGSSAEGRKVAQDGKEQDNRRKEKDSNWKEQRN